MIVLVFIAVLFFRLKKNESEEIKTVSRNPLLRILEGLLIVGILGAVVFVAGTRNEFFARIWEYWQRKPDQGTEDRFWDGEDAVWAV